MNRKSLLFFLTVMVVLALLAVVITPAAAGKKPLTGTVEVQILGINDFHGYLEPVSGSSGRVTTATGNVDAGGAVYLATHVKALRATNPYTVFVSAGDSIGASPILSALFHDEPTIEALNLMGMRLSTVGNHEFDEGVQELLRMQNGGCHPVDGCLDGDGFAGADFEYLTANVTWKDLTIKPPTLFPPVKILSFNMVPVAFIGVALQTTPTIVSPSGVAGLNFLDEVNSVNAMIPLLKKGGVETIVVILHNGGSQTGYYNECVNPTADLVSIAERLDDEVDVLITGHTHNGYNCLIDNKIVTGALSYGRLVTDIDLTIDRATGEVITKSANNVIVTRTVTADPEVSALIARYQAIAAPLANRVIGSITADITRATNAAGESALGDVIADAQHNATYQPGYGDAVAAFTNPGGIRTDLVYSAISGGELPGEVTFGEAFAVQPFSNSLVTMSLTGAQIDTMLEQQFDNPAVGQMRILQVSNGFTYQWSAAAPTGSKVDIATIQINGAPIDPAAVYRITVNSYLADGGDNFRVLTEGTDRLGGANDLDALVAYFAAFSPLAPGPQNRIVQVP